jgi:hydroxyacylglutathione hydrolase
MSTAVPTATTLRTLAFDDALARVDDGAALIDLRPTHEYLDVHVPGSLALLYERGPGMAARARDCLPLDVPFVLLAAPSLDMSNAAASLRGKGFTVLGQVDDAINEWSARRGAPTSTDVVESADPPAGVLLDVGDPGARRVRTALHIPVEKLWSRRAEVPVENPIVVASGFGVRAALAVGMLERAGRTEIVVWRGRVTS